MFPSFVSFISCSPRADFSATIHTTMWHEFVFVFKAQKNFWHKDFKSSLLPVPLAVEHSSSLLPSIEISTSFFHLFFLLNSSKESWEKHFGGGGGGGGGGGAVLELRFALKIYIIKINPERASFWSKDRLSQAGWFYFLIAEPLRLPLDLFVLLLCFA